jgi:mRNA deadenylase 3'-5' endonuclease subunit Ccr4
VFVSYNILGVENASKHPDLYFKIPLEFMEWERRKELICKEMHHYNAGILCFQAGRTSLVFFFIVLISNAC